jgi:Zn-dependent protease with chaperone function
MVTQSPGVVQAPRLNPFAFPSDTSFRFWLLIVFVVMSSASLYSDLHSIFHRRDEAGVAFLFQWLRNADWGSFPSTDYASLPAYAGVQAYVKAGALWAIGGVVLTLNMAIAIYWFTPAWKIRRNGYQSLTSIVAPGVAFYLNQLCREVNLSPTPTFLLNPGNYGSSAVAFGHFGRYYVGLSAGLVSRFYDDTSRPLFRAVVLHELAHLHNGDVDKTYITVALFGAFVTNTLVCVSAVLIWGKPDWLVMYKIMLTIILPTAFVLLTRNAVLRVRELYADVRASVWDGPSGALRGVLKSLPSANVGFWRALFQVHPTPQERCQAVQDPDRLLRLGFWDAFGAGMAAAYVILTTLELEVWISSELFIRGHISAFLAGVLFFAISAGASLVIFSLAVSAVGIGVWWGEFTAFMQGKVAHHARRLGGAVTLGALSMVLLASIHLLLDIGRLDVGRSSLIPASGVSIAGGLLVLGCLFVFMSTSLLFKWVAASASVWLDVASRSRSPSWLLTISLLIGSVVFTACMVWVGSLIVTGLLYSIMQTVDLGEFEAQWYFVTLLALPGCIIYLTVIPLWAFPLAASFRRKLAASHSMSTWAFLDDSSAHHPLLVRPQLRPGLALMIGVAAGLLYCALLLVVIHNRYIAPGIGMLLGTMDPQVAGLVFFVWPAFLMQPAAAAVAAGWIKRLPIVHGLCSASLAGLLTSFAFFFFVRKNPSEQLEHVITKGDFSFIFREGSILDMLMTLGYFSGPGILLALPLAAVVATAAGRIRGARARSDSRSNWVLLDGSPAPHPLLVKLPLRPGLALTIGLAAGLLYCLLLLQFHNIDGVRQLVRGMHWQVAFQVFFVGPATLMQAGAAAVAAASIRRLPTLHGLCSAFIAGLTITFGVMVMIKGTSLYTTIDALFDAFLTLLFRFSGPGMLLALPVAALVATAARWMRHAYSRAHSRP